MSNDLYGDIFLSCDVLNHTQYMCVVATNNRRGVGSIVSNSHTKAILLVSYLHFYQVAFHKIKWINSKLKFI
jgi:hypothetical protein